MSDFQLKPIDLWTFAPQDDMTPDELVAMFKAIAPALHMQLMNFGTYENMPENVKRHFQMKPRGNDIEWSP